MTRARTALVTLALLAVPSVAACGSDGGSGGSQSGGPYAAKGSPTAVLKAAPADYHSIKGTGFTISAPGEFQEQDQKSSNGQPMLILQKPSGIDALPQRVAVVRDVNPKQTAEQQSFALESAKTAGGPKAEAKRVQVKAPKDQAAFLVTWKEVRPTKGASSTSVTFWQLFWQVDPKLILNVVALAPTDQFPTSEVSRILRTFKPVES